MPEFLDFKGEGSEKTTPHRVGEVLPLLEKALGATRSYVLSGEELQSLSSVNTLALNQMTESDMAQYLNKFAQELEKGTQTPESLAAHVMFRAVLTKSLEMEEVTD